MLKSLLLNNDRYNSDNKKRKIKSSNSNNLYIQPIHNISNNAIKPIKIFQQNNTLDEEEKEYPIRVIKDDDQFNKKLFNTKSYFKKSNINNKKKRCNTIDINRNYSPKNKNKNNNKLDNNIYNLESYLTINEKNFKRNISQRIIKNEKIKNKLIDNISSLYDKINDNYYDLSKSKYNFYDFNKSAIETLFNDKRIRILNRANNTKIHYLKNDINNINNQIYELKEETNKYINNYNNINNEVNYLKNQCKILPEKINNLEIENKNLANKQIILHSIIQKIKLKLFELERDRKKIERNINQINMLYQ